MTVVVARRKHVHIYAFKWGLVVRFRRGADWTHVSVNRRRYQWRHYPTRYSTLLQLETWQTAGGVSERVPGSKRYVRIKVAL